MTKAFKIILAATIAITTSASRPNNSEVKVYVFFGSASQDCAGYGICRLYVNDGDMDDEADASGMLRLMGNHLELILDISNMRKEVVQKHFKNPTFFLYESFRASPEVSRALGVEGFKIPKGEYEYEVDEKDAAIYMKAEVPGD